MIMTATADIYCLARVNCDSPQQRFFVVGVAKGGSSNTTISIFLEQADR